MKIWKLLLAAPAALFVVTTTQAQNTGAVTNGAFAIGKGLGQTGFMSLLCGSAQLAVGQSAAAPICRTIGGDATLAADGTLTISNNVVGNAKLRDSGALSVIGRSANSSGDPADISCGSASDGVLRESGSVLGCGTIATGGIANQAVTLAKLQNVTTDRLLGRDTAGTGSPEEISVGGGLEFTGSTGIQRSALIGDVAAGAGSNSTTIQPNVVSNGKFRQSGALSLVGRSANSTGDVADIPASAGSSCAFRENSNAIGCGMLATAAYANSSVTNPKLAQMANSTVKCRTTAGTGDPEDCTATQGRTVLGLGTAATQNTGTSGANVPLLNGSNTASGNNVHTGTNDFQAPVKLSSFVTATQITASQNNYTATDGSNSCSTKQTLRLSSDASRNITGLACGQAEGDIRLIHNVGSQDIVLKNEDGGSTAGNRLLFGGDVTLLANYSITVRYDSMTARWRAITTASAGGGGGGTVTSAQIVGAGLTANSGTCTITTSGTCTLTTTAATASDQETGTSTTAAVVPNVQQRHPSAAKAWANVSNSGTATLAANYNVSGVLRTAAGIVQVNFSTAFSGVGEIVCVASGVNGGVVAGVVYPSATQAQVSTRIATSGSDIDTDFRIVCFGDQ
jgi:hypothetical protein